MVQCLNTVLSLSLWDISPLPENWTTTGKASSNRARQGWCSKFPCVLCWFSWRRLVIPILYRCICIICSTEFSLLSDVCTGNALAEKLRCEDNQSHSAQTSGDQYQTDQECSQSYKELNQRRQRCKDLGRIVQKMTTKKQLMVRRFRRKPPGTMF